MFNEPKEAHLDKLTMDRNVSIEAGLDAACVGRDAKISDTVRLAHVLLPKLCDLCNAGAGERT